MQPDPQPPSAEPQAMAPAAEAMPDEVLAPPPGWQRHTRRSPLTDPWEPLFARPVDALGATEPAGAAGPIAGEPGTALGLRVALAHCNARHFAHGGLLSALADNAMGLACVAAARAGAERLGRSPPRGAVTTGLALDFLDVARVGDWLTVQPVVLRQGGTLGVAECRLWAEDRLVARANATFRFV